MMNDLKKNSMIKKINILRHLCMAGYGAVKYRFPSKKMHVIGITGTSGKSTTVFLLRQLLEYVGYTVGSLSTIDFSIAGENKINDQKMTMLGRAKIQEYLREMVDKGCQIAIVETTSEGIVQFRHRFIDYDTVVLTNLYPEHIESHGGFENYKNAKKKLFSYTSHLPHKELNGKTINKTGIVNTDIEQASEFLSYHFDKKIGIGKEKKNIEGVEPFVVSEVKIDKEGLHFSINDYPFDAPMFGAHNAMNILATVAIARELGIEWQLIQEAVGSFQNAPGRLEFIPEAEEGGYQVIVDFSFEPVALRALYDVVDLIDPKRVIHVGGATGGGRDKARRGPIGELMGSCADIVIITDEDPYDEDPREIMDAVAIGARASGKKDGADLFIIEKRDAAIAYAVLIARPGDLILVTGKGSEQAMCIAHDKKIPWDDREIVRNALIESFSH